MGKFYVEDFYVEDNFQLRLLPLRNSRLSYYDKCPLCLAVNLEQTIKLSTGYLLKIKYPAVENSLLYVTNNCSKLPDRDNFYDIFKILEKRPTYIFFCNMLAEPSIKNHWHVDLVNSLYLPKGFVEYWFNQDCFFENMAANKLSQVSNKYGIYYICKLDTLELETKAKLVQQFYQKSLAQSNKVHIAITKNLLIINSFSNIDENISISAKSIFGYFTTGSRKKFEYMKLFGLGNIVYKFSKILSD